jgi:UDP-N-acetyl-D-glucosamine dehydrogenase
MPAYAVHRLKGFLRQRGKTLKGSKILVVGVTYKKDVKDLRKSPPLKLIELFMAAKCRVEYHDPVIPYLNIGPIRSKSIPLTQSRVSQFDGVVIATDHTSVNYKLILRAAKLIFDIKNVYHGIKNPKVVKL